MLDAAGPPLEAETASPAASENAMPAHPGAGLSAAEAETTGTAATASAAARASRDRVCMSAETLRVARSGVDFGPVAGWTAADMADQSGRVCVVTGANSGIGFHAARELAAHGARVILAVRDVEGKGADAAARMTGEVEVRRLDLADLSSVRAFAEGFEGPLDLLVNNAGVMATPRRTTADGFELQLGTNHLGHFALTGLLLDSLQRADAARIVTVSSNEHKGGKLDFENLQLEHDYSPRDSYQRSK